MGGDKAAGEAVFRGRGATAEDVTQRKRTSAYERKSEQALGMESECRCVRVQLPIEVRQERDAAEGSGETYAGGAA